MKKLKLQALEVASLYYKENMTQQMIAQKLGITRQTVSKLLKIAIDEGIVEIKINNPEEQIQHLERALAEKLRVSVVVGETSSGDDALRKLATIRETNNYLNNCVNNGNLKIGIAWGKTIQDIISQMTKIKTKGNVVYPLVGATNRDVGCYYTNKLVSDFSEKIGAHAYYALFPNYVSKTDCELIKRTQSYKEIANLWKDSDLLLIGIGNVQSLNNLRNNFNKEALCGDFIGDIVTHIFDINGNVSDLEQDSLCVPFDDIKRAKNTVAIAYGSSKIQAIICACKTGAINTLIIDEYTAKEILENI